MNKAASPHLKSFKDYYFGTLFRPRQTFDALLSDSRKLKFGLLAISLNAILYTLVYIFLWSSGGAPPHSRPGWQFPRMSIIFITSSGWHKACSAAGSWLPGGTPLTAPSQEKQLRRHPERIWVWRHPCHLFALLFDFTDSFLEPLDSGSALV
jgi:hypothetical protein